MPEITTMAELLDQLGSVIAFPDPLGELRARGFTLARDVHARLDYAGHPPAPLDPATRQQLAALASRLGRVRCTVTTAAPLIPQLLDASQNYDLEVALRLAVLNETLAALSAGMRYPRELDEAFGIGFIITRDRLDALSADVPPGTAGASALQLWGSG